MYIFNSIINFPATVLLQYKNTFIFIAQHSRKLSAIAIKQSMQQQSKYLIFNYFYTQINNENESIFETLVEIQEKSINPARFKGHQIHLFVRRNKSNNSNNLKNKNNSNSNNIIINCGPTICFKTLDNVKSNTSMATMSKPSL